MPNDASSFCVMAIKVYPGNREMPGGGAHVAWTREKNMWQKRVLCPNEKYVGITTGNGKYKSYDVRLREMVMGQRVDLLLWDSAIMLWRGGKAVLESLELPGSVSVVEREFPWLAKEDKILADGQGMFESLAMILEVMRTGYRTCG